jgi:hypothetical protein
MRVHVGMWTLLIVYWNAWFREYGEAGRKHAVGSNGPPITSVVFIWGLLMPMYPILKLIILCCVLAFVFLTFPAAHECTKWFLRIGEETLNIRRWCMNWKTRVLLLHLFAGNIVSNFNGRSSWIMEAMNARIWRPKVLIILEHLCPILIIV